MKEIEMGRIAVESSNLASVGYEDRILTIEFVSGDVYEYYNVPEAVYQELMDADSHGKYFNYQIKDKYECHKLI